MHVFTSRCVKTRIYLERIVLKVNRNLVQLQALAVLWRTAAVACRRIWQLEYGRITACIADHVEIRKAWPLK